MTCATSAPFHLEEQLQKSASSGLIEVKRSHSSNTMAPDLCARVKNAGLDEIGAMRISLNDVSLDGALLPASASPGLDGPGAFVGCGMKFTGVEVVTRQEPFLPPSDVVAWFIPNPQKPRRDGRQLLDLPAEILELLCKRYLDICSSTCLGLTCKAFFNITEHLYPFQVNLYTRTLPSLKCLGQLLTQWMAPKYTFDHSWGKYTLKRYHAKDEPEIERKWKEKQSWPRIRLIMDAMGAVVAYRASCRGFEEMELRKPFCSR